MVFVTGMGALAAFGEKVFIGFLGLVGWLWSSELIGPVFQAYIVNPLRRLLG